jgi:hypothetical protein
MRPGPSEHYLRSLLPRVQALIQSQYHIAVSFVAIPPPFTGDLDGAEVRIHEGHEIDARFFTLVHLFGHTVQWNTSDRARKIGDSQPGRYSAAELDEVKAYECEASRYSLQLLHEAGIADLDQWVSDFACADLSFLAHYYATGERKPVADFWVDGQPLLQPLAIPGFQPRRCKFRWDGVVLR